MTKRIFAIVLALVMSVSMFAVDAFAATFSGSVTATVSGTSINASWPAQTGASGYWVALYNTTTGKVGDATKITGTTQTYSNLAAGTYYVNVMPVDAAGADMLSSSASSARVTVSGATTTGGVYNNGTNISWAPVTGATQYVLQFFRGTATAGTASTDTMQTGYYISQMPSGTTEVKVYAVLSTGTQLIGSATLGSYGSTGTVGISGQYIVWTDNVNTTYTISFYNSYSNVALASYKGIASKSITITAAPSGATRVVVTRADGSTVGSCNLTGTGSVGTQIGSLYITARDTNYVTLGWASMGASIYYVKYTNAAGVSNSAVAVTNSVTIPCGANDKVTVEITAGNGTYQNQKITGTITSTGITGVTGGIIGGTTNTGNLYVTKGTTSSTVSWGAVSGAILYQVSYKKYTDTVATSLGAQNTTTATIPCGTNDTWTVSVSALVNGTWQVVGSTTVTPGTSSITGTTTTNGSNCTVVSNATTSTVTWPNTYATSYTVVYSPDGKTAGTLTTYTNSVQIPVGHSTDFTVYVIANSQVIATASVKKATGSTGSTSTITKTEIKNLTLDATAFKTKVSWSKVSGADYYYIEYSYLGASAGENTVTTATSVEIPFGKNTNYNVTVYAIDGSKTTRIGYANHVAGSSGDTVTDNDNDVAVVADTVTGFWAETLGDGIVRLNWNAVEDADEYVVYYRKVGATKWSGGHERTKTYLSIDFGSKTSTYEFKIVAGDEESTILTLKPNATKGTVAWAANPEADVDYETNLAGVVKDADNGKITLTWEEVDGADYKVYYRKAGTTSWKGGYERSGESITITFKASNIDDAYEIKVVADGDDSDVFTIAPSVWTNAD